MSAKKIIFLKSILRKFKEPPSTTFSNGAPEINTLRLKISAFRVVIESRFQGVFR